MSTEEKNTKRVLVADDDDSIRQLLCTLVRREKIDVDAAADGLQAIALLEKNQYDVILLDLMMPKVDGFEVVEFIKSHPTHTKPVVLVITAYADQKFKDVDSEIVSGVVRKPFEVSEIGNLIRLCTSGDSSARERLRSARAPVTRHFLPVAGNSGDDAGGNDLQ